MPPDPRPDRTIRAALWVSVVLNALGFFAIAGVYAAAGVLPAGAVEGASVEPAVEQRVDVPGDSIVVAKDA